MVDRRLQDMGVYGTYSGGEKRWGIQKIVTGSGRVAAGTWNKVLAGEPVTNPTAVKKMAVYLGWPDNPFERIMAGENLLTLPLPDIDPEPPAADAASMREVRAALTQILQNQANLAGKVQHLTEAVLGQESEDDQP